MSELSQTTLGNTEANRVHETYVTALQHNNAEIPADAWCVSVVNIKMYGIDAVTDVDMECLAPPRELFDEFRDTRDDLESDGLDRTDAHNAAWDDVNFESRYRTYLETEWDDDSSVRDACDRILTKLDDQPVAVVCYEGADKHCHRHILQDFLTEKHTTITSNEP